MRADERNSSAPSTSAAAPRMTLAECKRVVAVYQPCMPAILSTALDELVKIAEQGSERTTE